MRRIVPNKISQSLSRVVRFALFVMLLVIVTPCKVNASPVKPNGLGSAADPYLISDRKELEWIRERVNDGETFENCYFVQTKDIDLGEEEWASIGDQLGAPSFAGLYDGKGCTIDNLKIGKDESALFQSISGTILNLRIGSGEIKGSRSASIAFTSEGKNATIANCLNNATIVGEGSSGIVVDFPDGSIVTCVNTGEILGSNSYGIVASVSDVKIYRSYSAGESWICPSGVVSTNSYSLPKRDIESQSTASKLSLFSALSNYLFLDRYSPDLLGWRVDGEQGLTFTDNKFLTVIVELIAEWIIPAVSVITLVYRWLAGRKRSAAQHFSVCNNKSPISLILQITAVVFCDAYLLSESFRDVAVSSWVLAITIHIHAAISLKRCDIKRLWSRRSLNIPLLLALAITLLFELVQFDNVPRYDANIYYGSFVEGCQIFELNLLSFIGAFNCWKWAQGTIIFSAPFEFMMPGQIVSIYIGNAIVSIITLLFFNSLLKKIYCEITNMERALYCLLLMFSPYMVGLFSYFDMDWNVACYVVWLLYALACRDDHGVCISGLLLALTKITGIVFYTLVLFAIVIVDLVGSDDHASVVKEYFSPRRVLLWASPAILYLLLLLYGDDLTAQAFFGTYVSDQGMVDLFDINQIANTILQSFVFCFRWLLVILFAVSLFSFAIKKKRTNCVLREKQSLVLAVPIALLLTVVVLCIYNSDANCPRYTTILSPLFLFLLPAAMKTIFSPERLKYVLGFMLVLFISQSVVTIDPSIILYCDKIETGSFPLYKLAFKKDERMGMNLASGPNNSVDLLGDLYTYNLQYSFYDDLLHQAMDVIKPRPSTVVFSLNVATYEINLSGKGFGSYNIFYDSKSGKRSFWQDRDSVLVDFRNLNYSEGEVLPEQLKNDDMDQFWIIVPYRIDGTPLIEALVSSGYSIETKKNISNVYGSISLLEIANNESAT